MSAGPRRRLLQAVLGIACTALAWPGCTLTNIAAEDCERDAICEAAFGLGSDCRDGYCGAPTPCHTGHDCREAFGGGACVDGACIAKLPPDPEGACRIHEPEDLSERSLVGPGAPVVVGGMFALEDTADPQLAKAAGLAVREIDDVGGLLGGRPLAMVQCDVGGPGNDLAGEARRRRVHAVVDYLAGTLGAPFVVGPVTSTDSLSAVSRVLGQRYPTVLISPSATSPVLTSEPDRLDDGDPFGLFWRTAPSDVLQGRHLANDVVGTYPDPGPEVDRLAIVYLSDAYGEGLATVVQEQWPGPTDLFPFTASQDWDLLAASVEAVLPDAVVMVAVDAADTVGFIRAMTLAPGLGEVPLYLTDGSKDAAQLLNTALEADVKTLIFDRVVGTAPAPPTGQAYEVFRASYEQQFGVDPASFSFVAQSYDATYVGAAGVVSAATRGIFDGRDVAAGLSALVTGEEVALGKTGWSAIKNALGSGQTVDVRGASGELDFDPVVGEAPAPIEVWKPTTSSADCTGPPPCFTTLTVLE